MRHLMTALFCAALAAGCSRGAGAPGSAEHEPQTLAVTSWTSASELFMEHPPLVAGETVRFAVHLTRLADFSALNAGRPAIELTPVSGGPATTLPGTDPLRPGAFRVEGRLPTAGQYRWALIVDAPTLSDRHDLGTTTVYADAATAAAAGAAEDDATGIGYLKEQQWNNPFATAVVVEGEVRASVRVPATIEPVAGGEAVISAPADGRFVVAGQLPAVGAIVSANQVLGRLEPRLSAGGDDRASLAADVVEAENADAAAQAELARAGRLLAERAVPGRRVEDARRAAAVATARLAATRARLEQRDEALRSGGGSASGNAFVLRAPIAGRIVDVSVASGASYAEGARLFRIMRTDRVALRALVPAAQALTARAAAALQIELPGSGEPLAVKPMRVHDAGVLDPRTNALPVWFDVDNRDGRLLVGQTGTAILYRDVTSRLPLVPRAAVLMEAGRAYVFVQTSGERFARRYIDIGSRDGDAVGVTSGLTAGERVVTRGAYEVQLASASKGLPAEGHVH